MLREVLDPKRDPLQQGQSVLRRFFPAQCTPLFIHGDTGNGYRSYEVQISRILYSVYRVCADVGPPSSVRAGIWCAAFSKKSVPTACGKHFRSSASHFKHVNRVLQGSWTCDRARGNCSSLARRSAPPLNVLQCAYAPTSLCSVSVPLVSSWNVQVLARRHLVESTSIG